MYISNLITGGQDNRSRVERGNKTTSESVGDEAGLAHDLRNEFAEEFKLVLMSPCGPNRETEQVRARRNGGMKGKKGKRRADVRSDQEKQTAEATRRSKLVRTRGLIPAG